AGTDVMLHPGGTRWHLVLVTQDAILRHERGTGIRRDCDAANDIISFHQSALRPTIGLFDRLAIPLNRHGRSHAAPNGTTSSNRLAASGAARGAGLSPGSRPEVTPPSDAGLVSRVDSSSAERSRDGSDTSGASAVPPPGGP